MSFNNTAEKNSKSVKQEVDLNFGDKRSQNGSFLRWEIEDLAVEIALKMVLLLSDHEIYKQLIRVFSKKRIDLYFSKYFKEMIFPVVAELMILNWHKWHGFDISHRFVKCTKFPWYSLLESAWPDHEIKLVWEVEKSYTENNKLRRWVKDSLLDRYISRDNLWHAPIDFFSYLYNSLRKNNDNCFRREVFANKCNSRIAVCFAEGVNLNKRSDLFWLHSSKIEPNNVLIYFDGNVGKNQITNEMTAYLDNMGVMWVSLRKGRVASNDEHFWAPSIKEDLSEYIFYCKAIEKKSLFNEWLSHESVYLLKKVSYWASFYKAFNIKVHMDATESGGDNIIKNIAMDIVGGVCIGKERSCLRNLHFGHFWGSHPSHVIFVWNNESSSSLAKHKIANANDYIVVSGHVNDYAFYLKGKQNNKLFLKKKLKLIIGLFDNTSSENKGLCLQSIHSKYMREFYNKFINWVIKDGEVGLLIKSKNNHSIESLGKEIKDQLKFAEVTGRCALYTNEKGVMPSELSSEIDIAVTIGYFLPATLVEMVLCGSKAIHYDVTNIRPFEKELYKWGYEKIIFDDIDRMLEALKRYKENPDNEPGLGDWSSYVDKLDPFRDGMAAKRIRQYISWLIEKLDNGKTKDDAIKYANNIYSDTWGRDKVIDMRENNHEM